VVGGWSECGSLPVLTSIRYRQRSAIVSELVSPSVGNGMEFSFPAFLNGDVVCELQMIHVIFIRIYVGMHKSTWSRCEWKGVDINL
jgi:hypothetical protein